MGKIQKIVVAGLLFVFVGALPLVTRAATLSFSPQSGSYAVGSLPAVTIYVSSPDRAMNAASGVISFPGDKLEVVSLSKSGSLFSLWVQEPTFSNTSGVVNFEGIVLNPGFTGQGGKILSITFRIKAAGNAPLVFSSGSVLANDGKGTNILAGLGSANFSLGAPEPASPAAPKPAAAPVNGSGVPLPPVVRSDTHSDPNGWYNDSSPLFAWSVPSDVKSVRLLYDKYPHSQPTISYSPAISKKQLKDIEDGAWYLHVQFQNAKGWSNTSHFRFQIDTKPPDLFAIKFVGGKELDTPRPTILFDTVDSLSGVAYYKIKIGDGDALAVLADVVKNNPYTLPSQKPGKHTLTVQAFDRAGNYTAATDEFVVKPITPPIAAEQPVSWRISSRAIGILGALVPLAALLIIFVFLFWYGWHKFLRMRRRLKKEIHEAEGALHEAFDVLKENIREHIKLLEKAKSRRQLTAEEEKIARQLKKDLDNAEKVMKKKIEDIEDEVS